MRLMSKNNNVNPGQYKVGGTLRPGDDSSKQETDKARASIEEHERHEEDKRRKKEQSSGAD
jgi:hypothetical protein